MTKNQKLSKIISLALVIAVIVVFSRLMSIELPFYKFSLTFLPLAIMGTMFSPLWSMTGNIIADFIGMFLFPKASFFLGFTLNAALIGLIYSYFLHHKSKSWKNIMLATFFVNFGVNLFLTSLWLHMMYQTPFWPLVLSRLLPECITFVLQVITLKLMFKYLPKNLLPIF